MLTEFAPPSHRTLRTAAAPAPYLGRRQYPGRWAPLSRSPGRAWLTPPRNTGNLVRRGDRRDESPGNVCDGGSTRAQHRRLAGQVVREASGANAAAIQAAVDQFRADLGGANNGNTAAAPGRRTPRDQLGRRRRRRKRYPRPNPDDPLRRPRRLVRHPRLGFEISGQPQPEFGELNPSYPGLFAAFSSPRIFSPLNSNVMDVLFHVPGDTTVAAGVTGFGAVFTDVDSADLDAAAVLHPRRRAALRARGAGRDRQRDAVVPGRVVQRRRDRRPRPHRQRQRGARPQRDRHASTSWRWTTSSTPSR